MTISPFWFTKKTAEIMVQLNPLHNPCFLGPRDERSAHRKADTNAAILAPPSLTHLTQEKDNKVEQAGSAGCAHFDVPMGCMSARVAPVPVTSDDRILTFLVFGLDNGGKTTTIQRIANGTCMCLAVLLSIA